MVVDRLVFWRAVRIFVLAKLRELWPLYLVVVIFFGSYFFGSLIILLFDARHIIGFLPYVMLGFVGFLILLVLGFLSWICVDFLVGWLGDNWRDAKVRARSESAVDVPKKKFIRRGRVVRRV